MPDYTGEYYITKSELIKAADRYKLLADRIPVEPSNARPHFKNMLHIHLNQLYLDNIGIHEHELDELHAFIDSEVN